MGKSKSRFDLNHDWITHNDLIWRTRIWFGKRVIWFGFDLKFCDLIKNHSKSPFLHNTILLRVIDQRRRPCFVLTPLSFSNSTVQCQFFWKCSVYIITEIYLWFDLWFAHHWYSVAVCQLWFKVLMNEWMNEWSCCLCPKSITHVSPCIYGEVTEKRCNGFLA